MAISGLKFNFTPVAAGSGECQVLQLSDSRYNRFALPKNDIIETLYKTKTPNVFSFGDPCFELSLGEQTFNGQQGYFVRETHCWWDSAAKRTVRVQYTLSPRLGFSTFEEACARYNLQRTERARRGFVHSFIPRYEANQKCRYLRIEIAAQAQVDEKQEKEDKKQEEGKV